MTTESKVAVQEFWQRASCGEEAYPDANERYALEPYLAPFARFAEGHGRDVLEIGVGMGADHVRWAQSGPRSLTGVDLTQRAVDLTTARLQAFGFQPNVQVADAESLPFEANSFDLVYSYGVLHHSPDTAQAFREVARVLRPGGVARLMIYHTHSLVGYMLWLRYALMAGKPWRSLADIYDQHLESPGTKAYTVKEAQQLCSPFSSARFQVQLSFADLLDGAAGQRHGGLLLSTAKRIWPRWLFRRLNGVGLCLLIEAKK